MSTIKRIAKNTGIVFIGNNITKIFSFVLTIFLARYLGDKGFGVLSFAIAFTGLFAIVADMGLQRLAIREIARDREKAGKYVGNSLILKFALSIITFALIALIINLMNYPKTSVYAVYIGALILIIESLGGTFQSAFLAFEKMEYSIIPKIIRVIIRLSLTIPLLFLGFKVIAVLLAYLFVMFVDLIINYFFYTRKIGKIDFKFDMHFSKDILKRSLPFAIATVFIVIYFKIDITMLSIMKGDAVVGWYSAAYGLIESLHFLPLAFTTAIFPVAARYFIENKQKLILLYEEAMRYMFYLAIPIAVGTTI
ncbi:MAG: flippase, partial [Nanoarchaeota archaeon]